MTNVVEVDFAPKPQQLVLRCPNGHAYRSVGVTSCPRCQEEPHFASSPGVLGTTIDEDATAQP